MFVPRLPTKKSRITWRQTLVPISTCFVSKLKLKLLLGRWTHHVFKNQTQTPGVDHLLCSTLCGALKGCTLISIVERCHCMTVSSCQEKLKADLAAVQKELQEMKASSSLASPASTVITPPAKRLTLPSNEKPNASAPEWPTPGSSMLKRHQPQPPGKADDEAGSLPVFRWHFKAAKRNSYSLLEFKVSDRNIFENLLLNHAWSIAACTQHTALLRQNPRLRDMSQDQQVSAWRLRKLGCAGLVKRNHQERLTAPCGCMSFGWTRAIVHQCWKHLKQLADWNKERFLSSLSGIIVF